MRSNLSEAKAQALVRASVSLASVLGSKQGARYDRRCFSESCLSESYLTDSTSVTTLVLQEMLWKRIAAVLLFQYIFGEENQTLPSPKTRVRGITPGEIFACCLVVGEF